MMNPLTTHPEQQGVTYFEHWRFAMGIAYRLLSSVIAFALHAMLPKVRCTATQDRASRVRVPLGAPRLLRRRVSSTIRGT
jgi:hypothetical protein